MAPLFRFPFLAFPFLLIAVASAQSSPGSFPCNKPNQKCDAGTNFFPEKERIKFNHAKFITEFEYANNFIDVTIRGFRGFGSDRQEADFEYRLFPCGCDSPTPESRQKIFLDPLSLYVNESPTIALIDLLLDGDVGDLIAYVDDRAFVYTPSVKRRVGGPITPISDVNGLPDYTLLLEKPPSASIIGTFTVEGYEASDAKEIPYLVVSELLEPTALARAEWMKLIGLFLNLSGKANDQFDQVKKEYDDAVKKAQNAFSRPSILAQYPRAKPPTTRQSSDDLDEKYIWPLNHKQQYLTAMFDDANADYRYSDREPEEDPFVVPPSEIFKQFGSARYLIQSNHFTVNSSRKTVTNYLEGIVDPANPDEAMRAEMEKMDAIRCANVWNHQKRTDADGADDFFASAVFEPDELLKDFISIFHPDVDLSDRETFYVSRYEPPAKLECPFVDLSGNPPEGQKVLDQRFRVPEMDRFQIDDKLESGLLAELRRRVTNVEKEGKVEVYVKPSDNGKPTTVSSVRVLASEDAINTMNETETVYFGMRVGLEKDVKKLNDSDAEIVINRSDPDPPEGGGGGGGLSGGAIAGIVIAVLAAAAIVLFLFLRRRKKARAGGLPGTSQAEQYWEDPDVGTAGGGGRGGGGHGGGVGHAGPFDGNI